LRILSKPLGIGCERVDNGEGKKEGDWNSSDATRERGEAEDQVRKAAGRGMGSRSNEGGCLYIVGGVRQREIGRSIMSTAASLLFLLSPPPATPTTMLLLVTRLLPCRKSCRIRPWFSGGRTAAAGPSCHWPPWPCIPPSATLLGRNPLWRFPPSRGEIARARFSSSGPGEDPQLHLSYSLSPGA
jgi:hypothetical protein